jgi:NADH:ubiquinone oxidoreductase subunit E
MQTRPGRCHPLERSELRPLLRQNFPPERNALLPVLHFLQKELGHLPQWALQIVGWHLRIPASEVYGTATSYSELRLDAPPPHTLRICDGLGCWYSGGEKLLEELVDLLGVQPGETAADGEVSLSLTPCGYLCALAPVAEVDGRWRGRARAQDLVSRINGSG